MKLKEFKDGDLEQVCVVQELNYDKERMCLPLGCLLFDNGIDFRAQIFPFQVAVINKNIKSYITRRVKKESIILIDKVFKSIRQRFTERHQYVYTVSYLRFLLPIIEKYPNYENWKVTSKGVCYYEDSQLLLEMNFQDASTLEINSLRIRPEFSTENLQKINDEFYSRREA